MQTVADDIELNGSDGFISLQSTSFAKRFSVHFCCCHYSQAGFHPNLYERFEIERPTDIKHSVRSRQAEYLAGRYAAKRALAKLGLENAQVKKSAHRAPLWPNGTLGSISHTDEIAICVVSQLRNNLALGVDIEPLMTSDTAKDTAQVVMSDKEREYFAAMGIPQNEATTLAFSAKESLFKAIYRFIPEYLDFNTSELVFLDTRSRRFQITLLPAFNDKVPGNGVFHGAYFKYRGHLTTLINRFS